jgi:hypothetical protein
VSGLAELKRATDWIVATWGGDQSAVAAGAVHFLKLTGTVCGGWMLARSALVAASQLGDGGDADFLNAKLVTARFYADHILPQAGGFADAVCNGAQSVLAMQEAYF